MIVRPYEDTDFDTIQTWLDEHDSQRFSRDILPKFGQVAEGVCAGFIVETDNQFAFLDFYCTNPKATLSDRIEGSQTMLERAIARTAGRGFKSLIANTKSKGVVKFAIRHGFKVEPDQNFIFRKELSDSQVSINFNGARQYRPGDYEMVSPWLCGPAKEWISKLSLPNTGFVVDDLACVFITKTDSGSAIMDCFATNKKAELSERVPAADAVFRAAEKYAFVAGFKVLIGNTRSVKGLSLVVRHGFKYDPDPYFFIRKPIGLREFRRPNIEEVSLNAGA